MARHCRREGDQQVIHNGRRRSGKEACSWSKDTKYTFDHAFSILARLESFDPVLSSLHHDCCTLVHSLAQHSFHTLVYPVFEICRLRVFVVRNIPYAT